MENEECSDDIPDDWEQAEDKEFESKLDAKLKKKKSVKEKTEKASAASDITSPRCSFNIEQEELNIKILKRPTPQQDSHHFSNLNGDGCCEHLSKPGKQSLRSLEEREAAYAEARQRIFGSSALGSLISSGGGINRNNSQSSVKSLEESVSVVGEDKRL